MGRGWYVDTETWVLLTDSKTEAEKKKASAFESIKAEDEEDPEEVCALLRSVGTTRL